VYSVQCTVCTPESRPLQAGQLYNRLLSSITASLTCAKSARTPGISKDTVFTQLSTISNTKFQGIGENDLLPTTYSAPAAYTTLRKPLSTSKHSPAPDWDKVMLAKQTVLSIQAARTRSENYTVQGFRCFRPTRIHLNRTSSKDKTDVVNWHIPLPDEIASKPVLRRCVRVSTALQQDELSFAGLGG